MRQRGFTLLELMIVVAIAAIMVTIGLPSFRQMFDNARTKGSAESVLSGMRLARAEAIKRNAPMRFQLVSTLTAACTYLGSSTLWVVSQTDQASYGQVAGKCDQAPALPNDPCDASCDGNPYVAYKSEANTGTDVTVTVAADAPVITFGPLGQILANLEGTASLSQVTFTSNNASAKTWRVQVAAPGGSLKLCDTAVAAGQPYACS